MNSRPSYPSENNQEGVEETVDPRVQIELERLNAATDDINKLEVDLDEARAGFRQLLCESTLRIDALARKLGACVEKARPYYEARIKAKEALHETQLAAVRYERANSAHAAAKEMVYLAEEGLCTEGRTFDHAWQEMLNHATMRVNESELERTLSEAEHRKTSQSYQKAEIRVQQLQKDLKRSIAKSRRNTCYALLAFNQLAATVCHKQLPYFELKAQFNQVLEEQKIKVKELEKRVGTAKASYAEALSNLERISDEIHRIRKFETEKEGRSNGGRSSTVVGMAESLFPSATTLSGATTLSSSTDHWSDSETTTGSPDSESESEDQYLQLPEKLGPTASPIIPKKSQIEQPINFPEFFSAPSQKMLYQNSELRSKFHENHPSSQQYNDTKTIMNSGDENYASSSQILSGVPSNQAPEEENVIQSLISKIVPSKLRLNTVDNSSSKMKLEESDKNNKSLSYASYHTLSSYCDNEKYPLHDEYAKHINSIKDVSETWSEVSLTLSNKTTPESEKHSSKHGEVWTEVNLNDSSSQSTDPGENPECANGNVNTTPIRLKLDSGLSNWISRSSIDQNSGANGSRRQSLDTLIMGSLATGERVKEILSQGIMKLNISSLTERRSSESRADKPSLSINQATVVSATKKVPSPLEKSILYLHPDDDSASDNESLASVEMLNDDQISSLMLDSEIQEACQQVLGTPLSEVAHVQR